MRMLVCIAKDITWGTRDVDQRIQQQKTCEYNSQDADDALNFKTYNNSVDRRIHKPKYWEYNSQYWDDGLYSKAYNKIEIWSRTEDTPAETLCV